MAKYLQILNSNALIELKFHFEPGCPGDPDGPVFPGAPGLPEGPGAPGDPGSYVTRALPFKPVVTWHEHLERNLPKCITPVPWTRIS